MATPAALTSRTPRLTIRCEYTDSWMAPTEVSFRLSPHDGIHTAREAHDWFLRMRSMRSSRWRRKRGSGISL